jgi:hypothetical protein
VAAETGFTIDGEIYESPGLGELDMDEYQILYDYSKITIDDIVAAPDETDDEKDARLAKYDNPGFIRAMMHIAYRRAQPGVKDATVRTKIGAANVFTALSSLFGPEDQPEGDAGPPAQTTDPEKSSPNGSVDSNTNSGHDSENDSEQPAGQLVPIGTGRSDTSSPEPIAETWGS